MIRIYTLLTIYIGLLLPTSALGQEDFQQQKDSLLRVIPTLKGNNKLDAHYQMMQLVYYNEESMDTVLLHFNNFIAEAKLQNNVKDEGMVYVNTLAAYCNREQMKTAIQKAPSILDFLATHKLWEYYYQAYATLLEAYFFDKQYQKTIDKAKELYLFAKSQNNSNGISAAYYSMALVYNKTGRTTEAEEYFRKCIDVQQAMKNKTPLLTQSYFFLFEILSTNKQSDKAEELMPEWKKATIDYETGKNLKNPVAWGQIYTAYGQIYYDKGQLSKAELYCDSATTFCPDPSNLVNVSFLKALILSSKKEYAEALKLLDDIYKTYSDYNELDVTIEVMKAKMRILLENENNKEALSLFETILARKDSLTSTEFHAQLDELRTIYEVDKYIAEKEKVRNYMYFAIIGCIFLAILLGIWIYYSRLTAKKNKTMALQIKELQTQQEKTEAELLNEEISEQEYKNDICFCPESRKDKICIAIRDIMLKEKAYRNPALTRDTLVDRLGTNKDFFVDSFQHCFGLSFTEYLNSLRLKDVIILLEQSDLSIEEISDKAGFGTVRTLQRQFQTKYNMSPKEYRKAITN